MTIKFFDAHIRPPRGGWSYPVNGELIPFYSEGDIVEHVTKFQKNNGTFVSTEAIIAQIWDYFCSREPDRCQGWTGQAFSPDVPASNQPVIQADKTSAVQGPPIWKFLNTIAAVWTPGMHNYFLSTVDAIIVILECPVCREEWRKLLFKYPPHSLSTRLQVCQWVNTVHNEVNARVGKSNYPYVKMVAEYGAPMP